MSDLNITTVTLLPETGAGRPDWAAHIQTSWRSGVESIIETGRRLIEAKRVLPHGEFGKMIEGDLPFSRKTSFKLMAIATDKRLTNDSHVSHLPPSWGTLYELTMLSDDDFDERIANGSIHPDMTRSEVRTNRSPVSPTSERPRVAVKVSCCPLCGGEAHEDHASVSLEVNAALVGGWAVTLPRALAELLFALVGPDGLRKSDDPPMVVSTGDMYLARYGATPPDGETVHTAVHRLRHALAPTGWKVEHGERGYFLTR